ncbi:phage tail assembly chaperone [Brucella pituitosa]
MTKLRSTEPDALDAIPAPEMPPEANGPEWYAYYIRAWQFLRHDRQYGAFGGESPISFQAIDIYARRYAIEGIAFDVFRALVSAIDAEWLNHVAELQKQKAG